MPIPTTRQELIDQVTTEFSKLRGEMEKLDAAAGRLACVDEWSVKDLLAVRAWWTESVVSWIEAGRRGESPTVPAAGYAWNETPRLNAEIVRKSRKESLASVRGRLEKGFERVLATIDGLDDRELLDTGAFEWAGKWPIARWISINTTRQYATARTHIRRAMRERNE